jgi:hypothetical protein
MLCFRHACSAYTAAAAAADALYSAHTQEPTSTQAPASGTMAAAAGS